MRQAPFFVCSCLAIALCCGVAGAQSQTADKAAGKVAEKEPPDKPPTHKVQQGPFQIRVTVKGVFESGRMTEVDFRTETWTNLVVEKAVEHGQRVSKNDPLVWLDTVKLDEQLRAVEHNLKLGRLSLRESKAELRRLEQSLPLDRQAAERAKRRADDELAYFVDVSRPRSEKSADFSRDTAQYQLEYAQEELEQLQKMYEADDLTEETEEIILKRARRAVESSKFHLETAEISRSRQLKRDLPQQLEQLTETAKRQSLDLQRAKVSLPSTLRKKQLEFEKLREEQKQSAEQLAKLKKDRQAMPIRSPADGVVYYGRCVRGKWQDKSKGDERLQRGGTLVANQPLITIVAMQPLLVRVDLAEKDLEHVRRGIRGKVVPTGFPDLTLPVSLVALSQIPISDGIFDCRLRVSDDVADSRIVPGMTCTVDLVAYEKKDAITVPPAVIFTEEDDDAKEYVYVAAPDGQHEKRAVVIGRRTGDKVEIRRGLKAGEEVLLQKP